MEPPDNVPLPLNQAEFERCVVAEIASRHPSIGPLILDQFRRAEVTDRYGSKVGCFTHFAVPDDCAPLPDDVQSPVDGPDLRIRGVSTDSGFGLAASLLFLEQGKISMLECHAYGEGWPEDRYDFEFVPSDGNRGYR